MTQSQIIKQQIFDLVRDIDYLAGSKYVNKDYKTKFNQLLSELVYISRIKEHDIEDYRFFETIDRLNEIVKELNRLRDTVEYETILKKSQQVNEARLKQLFKERDLKKRFPNFSLKRYLELYNNPPLELQNYQGKTIFYDKIVARKFMIAINQMIFDEMDLYIINTGKEGSGKSCLSSQQLLFLYYIITETGLAKYNYKISEIFFSSIEKFLERSFELDLNDYFRILVLDEAYDLNRGNFYEQTSKIFKQDMRASRKQQKITILNLPQLGELDISITLSRANFIFETRMGNDLRTNSLKKGSVDMYIIPRGNKIYSYARNREIPRVEILEAFAKRFEKKTSYYVELPREFRVHTFEFNNVWGFNKYKYAELVKRQNKEHIVLSDRVELTEYMQYILYKKLPQMKHWGTWDLKDGQDKKLYFTIQKFLKKIFTKFDRNPHLIEKYERFTRKV